MLAFSRLWRKKDEPISKVLKELQAEINNHELRISALRQAQRSLKGQLTLYSVLAYLAYLVYYAVGRNLRLGDQDVLLWALKLGVVILFPCLVVVARKALAWWYARKIDNETHGKDILKTRLAAKLEELKEKSDYYNTQQLLQRYDPKDLSTLLRPPLPSNSRDTDIPIPPRVPSSAATAGMQHHLDPLRRPPQPPPQHTRHHSIPSSQNIPQFHPSAFTPPSSPPPHPPLLAQQQPKTFLDRILDLLVGEDENAPENRYALICRHCKTHNGLAPPGQRPNDVSYLCARCAQWNGPDPSQDKSLTVSQDERANQATKNTPANDKDESKSGNVEPGQSEKKS